MVNIAVARVMVSFVERTGAEYRPKDEASMYEAETGGLWGWLKVSIMGVLSTKRGGFGQSI